MKNTLRVLYDGIYTGLTLCKINQNFLALLDCCGRKQRESFNIFCSIVYKNYTLGKVSYFRMFTSSTACKELSFSSAYRCIFNFVVSLSNFEPGKYISEELNKLLCVLI